MRVVALRCALSICLLLFAVCAFSQDSPLAKTVPHRYIVAYRQGADMSNAAGMRIVQRHQRFGLAVVEGQAASSATTEMRALSAIPGVENVIQDRIVSSHRLPVLRVPVARSTMGVVARGNPVLLRIDPIDAPPAPNSGGIPVIDGPVVPVQPSVDPTDTFYTQTPQGWTMRQVGATGRNLGGAATAGVWDRTIGGGIRIAILDSGVDANHPDIAPNLALNMSDVKQSELPSVCENGDPQDYAGHGTWAASLAAGAAGASSGRVLGVAPAATILNIKVVQRMPGSGATDTERCANGQASGLMSWVIQGIDDAVAQGANVISLSLGGMVDLYTGDGAGLKTMFDRATHAAAEAGVVIVAALGNDGFDFSNPRYIELPAQARDVIPVVATTNPACAENLASGASCTAGAVTIPYYSNRGAAGAVAAPGGSYPEGGDEAVSGWVRGACASGAAGTADGLPVDSHHSFGCFALGHQQYVQAMGTSASTPLVAGVVALMRAAHPDWNVQKVADVLRSTGTTSAAVPYPQVDAAKAVSAQ